MVAINKTVQNVVFKRYLKIRPSQSNPSIELFKRGTGCENIASHTIPILLCDSTEGGASKLMTLLHVQAAANDV